MQQAMFANAHFRGKDEPAWEAGHFTGEKSRKVAKRDQLKQFNEKLAAIKANAALSRIKRGAPPPEDLPDLFTAPYKGQVH